MKEHFFNCPQCGGSLDIDESTEMAKCEFCDLTFDFAENNEVDKKLDNLVLTESKTDETTSHTEEINDAYQKKLEELFALARSEDSRKKATKVSSRMLLLMSFVLIIAVFFLISLIVYFSKSNDMMMNRAFGASANDVINVEGVNNGS